jgi:XTP/dITP diphosphohydrolase
VLTLNDIGCHDDIAETGATFSENAAIKSHYVYENYGLNCFGDDSGLEVDALDGAPGVWSARYAGEHGNHEANNAKLIKNLEGIANRSARFVTVISLVWEGREYFFEGTVEGIIRQECAGVKGFGYDPLFHPEGFDKTFAEMSLEEKNRLSHRAKAVEKLAEFLNNYASS